MLMSAQMHTNPLLWGATEALRGPARAVAFVLLALFGDAAP